MTDRKGAAQVIADSVGVEISPSTLAQLAAKGRGPRYTVGPRGADYTEAELQRYIDQMKAIKGTTRRYP